MSAVVDHGKPLVDDPARSGEVAALGMGEEWVLGGVAAPRTATTNANGRYSFDVTPGEWTIRVTGPDNVLARYRETTPTSLTLPVALGGASVSNFDFGYQPLPEQGDPPLGDPVINVNKLTGGTDGRCSLAEAIKAANTDEAVDGCLAGSGEDKIKIRVAGVITSGSDFQVKSNVTVEGAAGGTTISGGGGFKVTVGDATVTAVTLADLTVTGAGGPGVEIEDRAAAAVTTRYAVTLKNLHLNANRGGGVKLDMALASGRGGAVTVENTVLEANRVAGAYIDACAPTSEVTVTIVNSVVKANRGGGVHNMCGALKVENSLITGNRGAAGGIYADEGRNSGGVNASTETEVVNTTIAANTSTEPGGAITVSGSAGLTPELDLKNVTISANRSIDGPGGVHVEGTVDVSITNTVVAGNSGVQCSSDLKTTLIAGDASSKSGNASSDDSCGFDSDLENLTSDEVGLGDLADNTSRLAEDDRPPGLGPNGANGYVETMAIGASSKLFNAVEATACRDTKDARGVTRPQGSKCDIGAYEADEVVTIEGHVWVDANGDDARVESEGRVRVTVGLAVKVAGSDPATYRAVRSKETDGEGAYSFEVTPGAWRVIVTDTHRVLAGHGPVSEAWVDFDASSTSVDRSDLDLEYTPLITISGRVFRDRNGDGEWKFPEPPLRGVRVEIGAYDAAGHLKDADRTDSDGVYGLRVAHGRWTIRPTTPGEFAGHCVEAPAGKTVPSGPAEVLTQDTTVHLPCKVG